MYLDVEFALKVFDYGPQSHRPLGNKDHLAHPRTQKVSENNEEHRIAVHWKQRFWKSVPCTYEALTFARHRNYQLNATHA